MLPSQFPNVAINNMYHGLKSPKIIPATTASEEKGRMVADKKLAMSRER
ncbi:MAG: hypothetical protein MJZ27_03515 [Bacteroidales bacterium]|nr:hypothetical protein [Bacteroidales bacterium]